MLEDPVAGMKKIATLFGLDASQDTIRRIVDTHSFNKMSGGRNRGVPSENSFARKGVSGDWKNHFTPEVRKQYGKVIADFLIQNGDEQNTDWITEEIAGRA